MRAADLRQPRATRLISITQRCADADAIEFFANAAPGKHRALWLRPDASSAIVGVGAAVVLEAQGADRFASIGEAWRAVLATAEVRGPIGPRLLGGFSFDPERARSALWQGFPDGRFVLPERMLTIADGAAWLTTNSVIGTHETTTSLAHRTEPLLDAHEWQDLVATVASGIRDGTLGVDKLVLARALTITTRRPEQERILRNLAQAYPTCSVFAVQHTDATFVGATPERLVSVHNGTASTMALAASVPRGRTPAEDQLLAEQLMGNPKERAEHAVVVSALRDGLAADGLCTTVVADAGPRIRKFANVQHLFTPIRGQLAPGRTVLDLVERLHPTPAVGGHPTARAQQLLRSLERLDRGWYAAPLGWIDAHGEGEFVVGIRSALLRGETATLFAGCGIMADSDPPTELAESEWKLRAMREALVE